MLKNAASNCLLRCPPTETPENGNLPAVQSRFHGINSLMTKQASTYTCPAGNVLKFQYREKKERQGDRVLMQSCYQCPQSMCDVCPLAVDCLGGVSARKIKRLEGEELLETQKE